MTESASWWAVIVRIVGTIEKEGPSSMEEYSLRIVQAVSLPQAKVKAMRYAEQATPNGKTTDGKTISRCVSSVVGVEALSNRTPSDGDEIWSRLAFLDREEDQSFRGNSPPFWALRAFHTDWNIKGLEERR
jgi:hypothetical protein